METSKLILILASHKLWIESNGMQGECASLRGADLTGAKLTRASLYCANLECANLTGANLTGAYLTGANLTDADLHAANLTDANLQYANLTGADLTGANLTGADLHGANLWSINLKNAILPDVSWIIPGCLVQLNRIKYNGFLLMKECKWVNFVQDSFGFIVQNNGKEDTFDMLVEDRIIRNIPDWVKYSGLKQIASELV